MRNGACARDSFTPPGRPQGCAISATRNSSSGRTFDPGLSPNCPLTVTRRAMINACALEGVSTSPRATSATSRRSRFSAVASLLVVIATRGRIGDRIGRDALDGAQHTSGDGEVSGLAAAFQHQLRFVAGVEESADV